RQLLSQLSISLLVIVLLSVFFTYYASSSIIYQNKENELKSELAVITKILTKDKNFTATLQLYKSLLHERNISFVLLNKYGEPVLKQLTAITPPFRSKNFMDSLKLHVISAQNEKMFILNKGQPDPLMVVPKLIKYRDGQQPVYLFVISPVQGIAEMIGGIRKAVILASIVSFFLAIVISWLVSKNVSKGIAALRKTTREIAEGNYQVRSPASRTDELGDLTRDFNIMAAKLAESTEKLAQYDYQRRQFMADVSHELRTPLTSIRGIVEAVKNDLVAPEEQTKFFGIVEKETLRLIRLINELLDIEKIENGMVVLHKANHNLRELFDIVIEMLEMQIKEKKLRFVVDCAPSIEVYGDYDRIIQILINIVKNSIQFSEYGTITLQGSEDDAHIFCFISDSGKGMSKEELQSIWDRFYKADPSRSRD
ncbi:MAG: hypothetical protein A2189_08430, partial [Paenibacillus sp. RIFOXYA1_FULL_44_5]